MLRRVLAVMLVTIVVAVTLAGCGQAPKKRTVSDLKAQVPHFRPPQAKPDAAFVAAQERFACKLLAALHQESPDTNLFFSPASLSLALAMVANGARGETLAAIQQTLEWQGLDVARINAGSQVLMAGLRLGEKEPTVAIANALWADRGLPVVPDFAQTVDQVYRAPLRSLDLADTVAAARTVNDWAKTETREMIPEVVTPEDLAAVIVILANALYFEGEWTTPFLVDRTRGGPFHLLDGSQKQVRFMWQEGQYLHLERPEFQAVSLPYGSGRLSFYVFLPAEGTGLQGFLSSVTAANWADWQQAFAERQGSLKLPRFRAEYGEHLKETLTALGMGIAFDAGRADLSGMVQGQAWLSDVIHKAVVEVDEQGTRAAAVTVAPVAGAMAPVTLGPFTMVVDRPFLCAIRDNGTGAVLFLGVVTDPQKPAR